MDGFTGKEARQPADEGLLIIASLLWPVECTCICCGDGRGMSTAILMTTEQTKVRPVPDDLSFHQGGLEGISFAKSFDERLGISTLLQGTSTADKAVMAPQGVKNATPTKSDVVADIAGGVQGKH